MNYFVTAIGTDSGKTLVASIFCEAFGLDYWKPVQAGLPRDTETVATLITNKTSMLHPERYLLQTAISPHAAAKTDGVTMSLDAFTPPPTANGLVVEGAGGCLVPLNDEALMIDLIARLGMNVIVVSNHYLGSINHTLLTIEALTSRRIPIEGLVFNGPANEESERIILHRTNLKCLLRVNREPRVDRETVKHYANLLRKNWNG